MNRRSDRGATLMQILVAMAVALLLSTAAVAMLAALHRAFVTQSAVAEEQHAMGAVEQLLVAMLRGAGHDAGDAAHAFARRAPYARAGQVVLGWSEAHADVVQIRFAGPPGPHDCPGAAGGAASSDEAQAEHDCRIDLDAASSTLRCRVDQGSPQPLLDGVRELRLLYGIDSSGSGSVDRYARAEAVDDWSQVRAIRIALRLRHPLDPRRERQVLRYVALMRDGS